MIVSMSREEYATYQSLLAAGIDADLAYQQLVRWAEPDLQVETEEQPEVVATEQTTETAIEQTSQN